MSDAEQSTQAAEPNVAVVNRFVQAVNDYSEALQSAWMSPNIQQWGNQAYQRYMQALGQLMEQDSCHEVVKAWNTYLQLLQDALTAEEIQQPAAEAYHTYLQALKEAWAETAPDAVNASTLAVISQSIASGALMAAAANGIANTLNGSSTDPASSP
jgi:hypothetical protein